MSEVRQEITEIWGCRYSQGRRVSKWAVYLLAVRDVVLRQFWGRAQPASPPRLDGQTVIISKIDHLGDVLMATPLLAELKRQCGAVRLVLLAGRWTKPLAEILMEAGLCDAVEFYDAAGLNRTKHWLVQLRTGLLDLARQSVRLRRYAPALFLDLRPFSPNTLALGRLIKAPYLVGFGLRGLSFTLHRELFFSDSLPWGQEFLNALPALGLAGAEYRGPVALPVKPSRGWAAEQSAWGGYILLQLGSGERKREISIHAWTVLIQSMARHRTVVVTGSPAEQARYQEVLGAIPEGAKIVSIMGQTSLRDLFYVASEAQGIVSVDSLLAHLGIAYGLPTCVLTGANFVTKKSYPSDCPHLTFVDASRDPEVVVREVEARLATRGEPTPPPGPRRGLEEDPQANVT